ncbi:MULTISPECIES: alpha/beta hydrolase [unclassified Enterococcus]|uniref:alpha/beta hydrolase n=1 Tax=unclassified Enterococcus TaxID=2608891 RepID=UPI0015542D40|nr:MULTISPECIES: alpha/beta hydrolase [unclassified Enterococcus]MBS7577383.1 alpha/beta hydrolase [Enterococcus sp. MMGLQ5-2]MBS7584790.1 alpha/beta hydrolase [Enterococcus sp. MMGLQ5-1]NPD12645.1 alpha/beta hydrolase [Enterococcus sp. MMGLQ5-1]NPD37217.1 alpha/beta hydrolase [Enterococcus sp. MMGLQ5-2]
MKKFFIWLFGIILAIVLIIVIAFQVSVKPGLYIFSSVFNGEVEIQNKNKFEKANQSVTAIKNLKYSSKYQSNTFDIYYPKNTTEKVPVVFWAHGGGYIGGDKASIEEFANYLVSETNVAVIAMNYQVAPELKYPGQVEQMNELYQFIEKSTNKYPMLDLKRIFWGGDSAGAQIAGQYVAIQTNPDYAKAMNFQPEIKSEYLKGFISYCGPLDLKQVTQKQTDQFMMKLFIRTVAWSLTGTKNWQDSPKIEEISLVDKVTAAFPPTYITDGNNFSFQEQGIDFANQLEKLNVPVTTLFYNQEKKEINHEYQFNYDTKEALNCLNQTIEFIHSQLN